MSRKSHAMLATVAFIAGLLTTQACSSNGPTEPPYAPVIPSSWAATVTNQYFPLPPGKTFQFSGTEDVTVEVKTGTFNVNGVASTEVRDRVFVSGVLIEDTFDWYAQDADGNVWYLGEDTKEYENGVVVSTEGTWKWGVDGALPGIAMYADPAAHVGEKYRQEYSKGVAEDFGKVIATGVSITVPYGNLTGCVRTEDTSGLDPTAQEEKTYCPGLGNVMSENVGGSGRVELTGVSGP